MRPGSARATAAPAGENQPDRWLLTYADMITLLVALFILLYSLSPRPDAKTMARLGQGARETLGVLEGGGRLLDGAGRAVAPPAAEAAWSPVKEAERLRRRMEGWIQAAGLSSQVRLAAHPDNGLVIRLDSGAMLFDTGTADVQPRTRDLLRALEAAVAPALEAGVVRAIRVEGHTDDQPIASTRFASNWQLSSARAAGVAAFLARSGGDKLAERVEATGYGDSRPVAPNRTPAGRRRNRRVEIRVLFAEAGGGTKPGKTEAIR